MGYACPEYAHERSCWTGSMSKTPVQESVRNAQTRLMQLITGFVGTQAVHVAAQLGIADLIAAERMTAEQLAAATGAHAASLYLFSDTWLAPTCSMRTNYIVSA